MTNKVLLAVFMGLFSLVPLADTVEQGPFTVSKIRLGEGGLHVALDPAPAGCGGGAQYSMHLKLEPNVETYHKEMISGLLAAYTTGSKLSHIWFSNGGTCSNNHILNLYMFQLVAQ
ncbi:hypothetical protein FKG94_28375 [Exilibacterium tricleocarpae]|uniref:Uncharacterized protein n=1 Tax=Exilibacterium tricleocarpae TaxID=2591008 RepID=A0A545SL08_9GAMM|nr:hypothetical protein [Exilibacterium tricleocarpae]TQV65651.1 hypothetical protein FKG94_28375 [Exilibacterium tricleocarpae]